MVAAAAWIGKTGCSPDPLAGPAIGHPSGDVASHPSAVSVYVDDPVTLWRGQRWAHLMADSLEELHAFAAGLGLPRGAFQDRASGAHYDVNAALREQAIALGAVAISRHRDRALVRAVIANARAQGRRPPG